MLLKHVDRARLEVSPTLDAKRRGKLGQFMTPALIAADMAAMFHTLPNDVRLLDAGAGMGALTAAFVADSCKREQPPRSITVTCYEVDQALAEVLTDTLMHCAAMCAEAGIDFSASIVDDDYILRSAEPLLQNRCTYNCIIMNPPYAKLSASSRWRIALRSLGIETVNLYAAFVAVALQQLEDAGELVAITPRSFCNGPYYESFRQQILSTSAILAIHVFESRKSTFKDDDVLQENVIYHVQKGGDQGFVSLSTDQLAARHVPFAEVVNPDDRHLFIRLAISQSDTDLASRVQALPCKLSDLGIKVSTGRVVDFRTRAYLRKDPGGDTVPLIYPAHFRDGEINWPKLDFKKCNALAYCEETISLVVPAGTYVLTKRFSSKEEKRRLVAAVYNGSQVGFENHLNYFHQNGFGLDPDLARGLCIYLNSAAVDQYFRTFSGHTQVNATDLRTLQYPSRNSLLALSKSGVRSEREIDAAVEALL